MIYVYVGDVWCVYAMMVLQYCAQVGVKRKEVSERMPIWCIRVCNDTGVLLRLPNLCRLQLSNKTDRQLLVIIIRCANHHYHQKNNKLTEPVAISADDIVCLMICIRNRYLMERSEKLWDDELCDSSLDDKEHVE
jgi:hypothetical protein